MYEKTRPLFVQELEINEKLQFRFGLAGTWIRLGELYRHEGDYIQAEQCFEKSMSVSRDLGLKEHISSDLYLLSLLALHQNDYLSAVERFREYFNYHRVPEKELSLCRFLTGMSAVAGGTNQPKHCAKLFGAAQWIIQSTSDLRMDQFDRAEFDRHIQIARDQLGNLTFEALSKEGSTMTMEQAFELTTKKGEFSALVA